MAARVSLRIALLAIAAFIGIAPATALSQPAGAHGEDFLYRTMPGDTLVELAERFTDTPSNWTLLQQLNAVAKPRQLPMGKTLRIPFSLIPVIPASIRAEHISGDVSVDGSPLRQGATLEEGTVLQTGVGGFATLTLVDGSTITVDSNATIRLPRIRAFKNTGLTDTIVCVEAGSVDSVVSPEKKGVGRFEIRTPVAVAGVRGTRLRVHSDPNGSRTELLKGRAHLGARQYGQVVLTSGQGATTGADGNLNAVRTLLPKPQLSAVSRTASDQSVSFAPVAGATGYLVRVAADPEGTRIYSSELFISPPVTFDAPKAGMFYVMVRAIDEAGLMSEDATLPFRVEGVVRSGDGRSIVTGYGDPLRLGFH